MSNWYYTSKLDKMEKEASFKDGVILSLIALLSGTAAWFEGTALSEYLEAKNVAKESFTQMVNQLNSTNKSLAEMDKSDVVLAKDNYISQKETNSVHQPSNSKPEGVKNAVETRETLTPLETIARTIYDEARGEGYSGMKAVSEVILNSSDGTPESLKKACLKPWRFSGWNNNNLISSGKGDSWTTSLQLAKNILSPETKPNSKGNIYFCNPQLVLKQKGIKDAPRLLTIEDLKALPEEHLKLLPAFMFKPAKNDLGKGAWKYEYSKTKQNLRTDFTTIGKQLFYSK